MRLIFSTPEIVARRSEKRWAQKKTASAGDRVGRRVLPAEADPVVFGCPQTTSRRYVVSRYIFGVIALRRDDGSCSGQPANPTPSGIARPRSAGMGARQLRAGPCAYCLSAGFT